MSIPFDDKPVHYTEVDALLSTVEIGTARSHLPTWAHDPGTAAQFAAAIYLVGYPHVSLVFDEHGYLTGYRGIRFKTEAERAGEGRSA